MKSKELLESIKHTIEGVFYPRKMYKKTSDEFKLLEKDVEVLEILKDKLPHITTLRVMECEGTYELYNDINYTSITKEEYELLKEWLNEKEI